jgi:hypothetical protein
MRFEIWFLIIGILCFFLAYFGVNLKRDVEAPKDEVGYIYRFKFSMGMLQIGILFITISLISFLNNGLQPASSNKIIGIVSFIFAVLFAVMAVSVYFSKKFQKIWETVVHPSKYPERDKKYSAIALAILSGGFLFNTYLYYFSPY